MRERAVWDRMRHVEWEWEWLVGGWRSSWQLVAIAPSQLDCFAFAFDSLIFSATALKLARVEEGGGRRIWEEEEEDKLD